MLSAFLELANNGDYNEEYRIVRPDGGIRWIKDRGFPVRDEHGNFCCVAGLGEDITARKEIEQALQERDDRLAASAERTRLIIASAQDAFVAMDSAGIVTDWNPEAEATFGWSHEEAVGRLLHELVVPPAIREAHLDKIEQLLKTGHCPGLDNRIELELLHRDGYEFPVELTVTPIPWGDGLIFSVFLRDVTKRKRAEADLIAAKDEAERANAAKSEFLSRMSHELRTPLNAIIGFSQLLETDAREPEEVDNVNQIVRAGRHLLALINEVLDISGIEAGRMALSIEPVPVGEALQETLGLVRPAAAARHVSLADFMCEHYVLADRQRLTQVMLNLLSNAIKYNREGGSVVLSCTETDRGRLRISVRDTGPGMTPGDARKVFAPFERLRAAETKVEGIGLGLTISKRLVESMGGAIGVDSVLNQGSSFWVDLPIVESPVAKLEPEAPATKQQQHSVPEATLLYIEDNLSNLKLIERALKRRRDIKLLAVMQGQFGLDLTRQHQPDLVLLDLHLPDIEGDKVLEQLRADPATAAIPVVMITADATPAQKERLIAAGAREYLTKPIDVKTFLSLLDRLLNEKRVPIAPV